ncbi:MAG: SPFH domain-containing protein [Candidatus Parvarchaeota archaeon]|nr:SPFH domain-containing protein [Candidatus Jingweiarchaeum tengchongense]MCW1298104.1 SPFH domain-containing protein [Candidatus Jingweiarchaeum tengchongense]MCW1300712.1 SPFH domain-containing protein [Candidatus Jingweiarchaeum tengchongense]MCW1305143.1 SPFH domain-containing protein [Candidatus Jingweiarchaeum tengchongense]MCW1305526.1 SPFH domain-containing protein [Candidatus Jingweiarchaeum tengchongense]
MLEVAGPILIIIAIFALMWFLFPTFQLIMKTIFVLAIIYILFALFVKKYDEYERGIIFRIGKFNRVAGPGWSIVIPFIEKEFTRVDVRTRMMNLFVPMAFTKDDLRLKIDGIVYYRIVDANKAVLQIENYLVGLGNMIQSETRNAIASMNMREVFANMDKLNDILADRIRHTSWKWGIDVPMVQIRGIAPPEEIAIAMQQKEIAANMLQAQKFNAEARKVVIEAIGEAAKKLDDMAIMYLYIKALEEISKGSATKIIFPMQFIDILKGMEGDVSKALAGLNLSAAVNAVAGKITEVKT